MSKKNNKVKDALEKKRAERQGKPSKAEMEKNFREVEKQAYEKNAYTLMLFDRYKQKILGNAKFNEDEFKRKAGRMKIITANYEWELDEVQQQIDEKRLQQVYYDTRETLAYELKRLETSINKITEQQKRILKKHPEFKEEIIINPKMVTDHLDAALKEFQPITNVMEEATKNA